MSQETLHADALIIGIGQYRHILQPRYPDTLCKIAATDRRLVVRFELRGWRGKWLSLKN